jgi:hypothetical protein
MAECLATSDWRRISRNVSNLNFRTPHRASRDVATTPDARFGRAATTRNHDPAQPHSSTAMFFAVRAMTQTIIELRPMRSWPAAANWLN